MRYVFVHGAWHDAECWNTIVDLLRMEGHQGEAIDLPGSGQDKTSLNEVTLEKYVQKVKDALAAEKEPAILVGHSLGGLTISQTAEEAPESIRMLVYVAASMPCDGETLLEMMAKFEVASAASQ